MVRRTVRGGLQASSQHGAFHCSSASLQAAQAPVASGLGHERLPQQAWGWLAQGCLKLHSLGLLLLAPLEASSEWPGMAWLAFTSSGELRLQLRWVHEPQCGQCKPSQTSCFYKQQHTSKLPAQSGRMPHAAPAGCSASMPGLHVSSWGSLGLTDRNDTRAVACLSYG